MQPVRVTMWGIRGLLFVTLNVFLVGFYCFAMSGKLEPLKFHPTRFVTLPLMVITAVIAVPISEPPGREPASSHQSS